MLCACCAPSTMEFGLAKTKGSKKRKKGNVIEGCELFSGNWCPLFKIE